MTDFRSPLLPICLSVLACAPLSANAQTPDAAPSSSESAELQAPGWQKGLSTNVGLTLESVGIRSPSDQRSTTSTATAQFGASLDTEAAGLWKGGTFDALIMGTRTSADLEERSGDVQLPSNIWATNFLRLYQFSYTQQIGPGFVQAGIMDVNNRFATTDAAAGLHNSSFGIPPTLTSNANIATYPNPGLGLIGGVGFGSGWEAMAGVWQADPPALGTSLRRGTLALAELDKHWGDDPSDPRATAKIGVWHINPHDADGATSTGGVYGMAEWNWKALAREWAGFVQLGRSPDNDNLVTSYVGAGVRVRGLIPARPDDVLTVGVAQARLNALPNETAIEAVYACQLTPHVILEPDLQRIANAGGTDGTQWVLGLRLRLEH